MSHRGVRLPESETERADNEEAVACAPVTHTAYQSRRGAAAAARASAAPGQTSLREGAAARRAQTSVCALSSGGHLVAPWLGGVLWLCLERVKKLWLCRGCCGVVSGGGKDGTNEVDSDRPTGPTRGV